MMPPNWVDHFFRDDDFFDSRWLAKKMTTPAVNIRETDKAFDIEVAAPGMKKEDFKVELKDGMLSISAENKMEKEEKEDGFTRKEFSFNSFCRSFWMPDNVRAEDIKAAYNDGLLKITLPKVEVEKKAPAKTVAIS